MPIREQMENRGWRRAADECGARRELPRVIVSGIIKFDGNGCEAVSRWQATDGDPFVSHRYRRRSRLAFQRTFILVERFRTYVAIIVIRGLYFRKREFFDRIDDKTSINLSSRALVKLLKGFNFYKTTKKKGSLTPFINEGLNINLQNYRI